MKKYIIIAFVLLLAFNSKGQTPVYTDDFESYNAAQSLISTELYQSWEALSAACLENTGFGANSSNKYASLTGGTSAKTQYFRKTIPVSEGHTYTYKVFTKSKIDKGHKIGYRIGTGASIALPATVMTHTTWTETSTTFTIPSGSTTVDIWVQYYGGASGGNGVDVDNIQLIDISTTTGISSAQKNTLTITKNRDNQISIVGCEVQNCEVLNLNGGTVSRATTNNFYAQNISKGIYIIKVTDKKGNNYIQKISF